MTLVAIERGPASLTTPHLPSPGPGIDPLLLAV